MCRNPLAPMPIATSTETLRISPAQLRLRTTPSRYRYCLVPDIAPVVTGLSILAVTNARVQAHGIVKRLHVREHSGPRSLVCGEVLMFQVLAFQAREEALHRRIVVAVAPS